MNLRLRPATGPDVLAYYGRSAATDWCIGGRVAGYVAERASVIVAIGVVTWDRYGRAWGWFGNRERIAAVTMHRRALAVLAVLRQVGEPVLHAICADDVPGADKWLRRLGFMIDGPLTEAAGEQVWSRRLDG